ncbi:MAG: YebC/PmpR family DNA-binding transcriptional regulator [Verrucomicrobiales bacterium]|nr:YebC/PmpR family DNA-binding transcriptional regulator [Verrucomicrobiales bacterium]
MSGHNKWSKIKHIKAKEDAKKGKVFSKFAHEIAITARDGGGDPNMNPRLRQAIDSAKSQSMPKDNIERAIKKGTGELDGGTIEEITYEGFGAGGAGFLVQVATDNKNRSAADIRSAFNKNNGNMGTAGTVSHMFDKKGEIIIDAQLIGEEEIFEKALEAGADDVISDDDEHIILTAFDQLNTVAETLREGGLQLKSQSLAFIPSTPILITENSIASQVLRLYDALDDYDDTISVFGTFEISDEILESLS